MQNFSFLSCILAEIMSFLQGWCQPVREFCGGLWLSAFRGGLRWLMTVAWGSICTGSSLGLRVKSGSAERDIAVIKL